MKKTGIYKIVNLITEKVYVGSAVDIDDRWYKHKKLLVSKKHHSPKLQNSVDKHGLENFLFEIIEECSKEVLIEKEQYWIDKLCSYKDGYNVCPKAGSSLGRVFSEKTKEKIRKKAKGNKRRLGIKHSNEAKLKIGEKSKNKSISEETKNKISLTLKGRKHSEETKNKISKSVTGNQNWLGRKHSEETKVKMREAYERRKNNKL